MKRIILVCALSLAAAGVAAQPKEIRIGCYAPLTGPVAKYGKAMDEGFRMAIEDFTATGRLKGVAVSIQCEDDQNRADDGINIARKFIEDRSILAVLGSWASTVTLAAGPIYNQAKLVNLTPISSHPDVTKIGPYMFRQSIIQSAEGAANAAFMTELGAKRVAMLGIPNDYGKANVGLTRRALEAKGVTIVFEEFIRPDAQDFRQVLQKALREKPDMLYLGLFAPQASLVLKQYRQLGAQVPVYGAAALGSNDLLRLAGDAAEGMKALLVLHPAVGQKMADFYRRYEAKYKAAPETFAANAYISARMLLDMIAEQYPNLTRESIREGLEKPRTIDTIAGPLAYDPKTREWSFRFTRSEVAKGEFRPLQ
ncbi:MAG: ABC transporter substrate-binding protein [Burkholderiales bacterium]|nr:ABC transporter substrate-binding protein [Burkholderiales bacterium]